MRVYHTHGATGVLGSAHEAVKDKHLFEREETFLTRFEDHVERRFGDRDVDVAPVDVVVRGARVDDVAVLRRVRVVRRCSSGRGVRGQAHHVRAARRAPASAQAPTSSTLSQVRMQCWNLGRNHTGRWPSVRSMWSCRAECIQYPEGGACTLGQRPVNLPVSTSMTSLSTTRPLRFGVWGSRFKVRGPRFKVQGARFKVQGVGLGFGGWGLRFGVWGSRYKIQGLRCGYWGFRDSMLEVWSLGGLRSGVWDWGLRG